MTQLPQTAPEERSLDSVPNAPARDKPVGFILRLAKALHTYGVPAYELETTLTATANKLGFGLQCLSLPTSITMTLMHNKGKAETYVIRVAPGEVNLEKLRRVSQIAHQVMKGELSTSQGADELRQLNDAPGPYSGWLVLVAFALVSGAVSRLFGGGVNEIITATVAGFSVGVLALISLKVVLLAHLLPAIAALFATLTAYTIGYFSTDTNVYIPIVSGLIVLLPGLSLTIAMAELATQNLMSGTARIFGAATVFILMAFGTVIGKQMALWLNLPQVASTVAANSLPEWTVWPAVLAGSLALVVLFQARWKEGIWVILSGFVAYASVKYAGLIFNNALAAFCGAIAVGVTANLVSRFTSVPGATLVVPGFIILVPGSVGFKSLTALVDRDIIGGLDSAFSMALVGISLVAGLLLSSLVTLPKERREQELETEN